MGILFLVVTRIGDCNEDIKLRFYIPTHSIPGDKDIQTKLHQLRVKPVNNIHVYSQINIPNGY